MKKEELIPLHLALSFGMMIRGGRSVDEKHISFQRVTEVELGLGRLSPSPLVTDFTTDRLQSKGDGSRFYPYGESKTGASGDDREQFATYTRDERSGLDYADQRWYASGVGRFTSVDTYEVSVIDDTDHRISRAWNKYSYAHASPVEHIDSSGLWPLLPVDLILRLGLGPKGEMVTVTASDPGGVSILGLLSGYIQELNKPELSSNASSQQLSTLAGNDCLREGYASVEIHKERFLAAAGERTNENVTSDVATFLAIAKAIKNGEAIEATVAALGGGPVGVGVLLFSVTVVTVAENIIRNGLVGEPALNYIYNSLIYSPSLTAVEAQCRPIFPAAGQIVQ